MRIRKGIGIMAGVLALELLGAAAGAPAWASGWTRQNGSWYWMEDGSPTPRRGWLSWEGRWYYLEEDGAMAVGWRELDGQWYYFHEDGGMNTGELLLDQTVYSFDADGRLTGASRMENTGGGAYEAACYDEEEQSLFDALNEEKRETYFDAHPDWDEDTFGSDSRRVYDRYASFRMNMVLNRAAQSRLAMAQQKGFADGRIPGEGTIHDYLAAIPYRQNATCLELYIRGCTDGDEAYEKLMARLERMTSSKSSRAGSLEYYRSVGIAHSQREGKEDFMVLLMR